MKPQAEEGNRVWYLCKEHSFYMYSFIRLPHYLLQETDHHSPHYSSPGVCAKQKANSYKVVTVT